MQIQTVSIEGATSIPAASIETRVQALLGGQRWVVFPQRNALLYPQAHITEVLYRDFPKLRSVELSLQGFTALAITVEERAPHALWCRGTREGEGPAASMVRVSDSPCLFIDVDGISYESAPEFSGDAYVQWFNDHEPVVGVAYAQRDSYAALSALINAFKEEGLSVVRVWVDGAADVHVTLASGVNILFVRDQKAEKTLQLLRTAMSTEPILEKGIDALAYLDLRFGNRLYYKLK